MNGKVCHSVEGPFWGTIWFSQQTDDYFVQLTPFHSLVQCHEVITQLLFYNSLLNQCYTHFYISQETSCLVQTE